MQNVAFYSPQPMGLTKTQPVQQTYNTLPYAMTASSTVNDKYVQPAVSVYTNVPAFYGCDVYIANQGVVVGREEKRYIRLRWGDGTKGNKARWVGFAPSDWKKGRPLDSDPELLGFYVKPNLCDRTNKNKQNVGWVTLSIDCDRRAVKATIDGWTLGKVFIPTWLIGRVMRPVAIAEAGTPVEFNLRTEENCEKVLRSGFKKWATIRNTQLELLKCQHLHTNFEHNTQGPDECRILSERAEILGMQLYVEFDDDSNVKRIIDCDEGYISYEAVDMDFTKPGHEVLPLVINDRHAYRVKGQGLWDLFWHDGKSPLDYLSERITALTRTIYEAKMRHNARMYKAATNKLSHMRHILYFLSKDYSVVEDANNRVEWFLSNTDYSGTHRNFTPDLGRLLVCLSVSDYQWEEIAVPFFTEALHRALPAAILNNPRTRWQGPDRSSFDEQLEALLITDGALAETILQVQLLNHIFKPHHPDLDNMVTDRLSAEELCCGLSGLGEEFQILEYVQSSKKDDIKKCLIKREWEDEFTEEQWMKIETAMDNKACFRGIVARSRMVAECHGTGGLPTQQWFDVIDQAIELAKTLEGFDSLLDAFGLDWPGHEKMESIMTQAVQMSQQKGYITEQMPDFEVVEGVPSSRCILELNKAGKEKFERQGRDCPAFEAEILPKPASEVDENEVTIEGESITSNEPLMASLDPASMVAPRPPFVGEPSDHESSVNSEGAVRVTNNETTATYIQPQPGTTTAAVNRQWHEPSIPVSPPFPMAPGQGPHCTNVAPATMASTTLPGGGTLYANRQTNPAGNLQMITHPGLMYQQPVLTPGYNSPTPPMQPTVSMRQTSGGSVASNISMGSYGGSLSDQMSTSLNEKDKALLRRSIGRSISGGSAYHDPTSPMLIDTNSSCYSLSPDHRQTVVYMGNNLISQIPYITV